MLGGKKKYKCRFDVKVEKIEGLPDKIKGSPFRVEYARGKDQSGISRTLTMISKNMAVNYSFKLECNLMFEEKKGARKFAEKSLTFQVVAEKSKDVKKDTNIGKADFDLSTVAVPGEYEAKQRIECHGKDKSDVKCVLIVSFKTEVVKIDGKKLVKADPSKPKAGKGAKPSETDADPYGDLPDFGEESPSSGRTIEVGGQEYDLQTDHDLSEAGVESDNDAKTENDYLSDSDDGKDDPFEQDAEPTEEEKRLAKKLEEEEKRAGEEAKKLEDAKKAERAAEDAVKAAEEAKRAADAATKAGDEKKRKEDEKKAREEEEKRKKEEEKKRKEDEKKAKEEEEKRKKEEDKKRKEDEKKAKEEEDKRKKQEKADLKAGIVSAPPAASSASSSPSVTTKDTPKDSKKTTSTKSGGSSADLSESSSSVAALEAALKQAQDERDAAVAEKARLTADLERETQNTVNLKKSLKTAETALKDAETKLKREETKSADLQSDLTRLQDKLAGAAVGASAGSASSASSDAAEISRLEGQMRKLRQDNQALQGELDNVTKKWVEQQELVANHDAGHALKQISDLETENAKLRAVLDDHNLLKGNLIQELKHRQSERHIRIERHQKDVDSGNASAEEITTYKPRHSRQNSSESSGGAKSPRLNGSASNTASSSSYAAKKEQVAAPEPKKPKKAISMEDDSSPVTSRTGSKRASTVPAPAIIEDMDQFSASDSSEKLKTLETRLVHDEKIEACLYNAKSQYDEAGMSMPAQRMADYIIRQKALDRKEQHTEASHALLVHLLTALYGQAQRHASEIDVLLGILQWSIALLQILQKETSTLEDAPVGSHMTWAVDIDGCGVILKFDALIDAVELMGEGKFKVEKTFDDIAADATPGEAFLQLLDQIVSYVYVQVFVYLQSLSDEQKLTELFFGQTSQLAAALNGSNPHARNQQGVKRAAAPKAMSTFTAPLEPFLQACARHSLHKTIESQLLGQFFFWCSSSIVNALVQQTEHCSAAVGMSLKVAVSHVEQWISQNSSRRFSGWIEEQFAATREAANVLTIDKQIFQSIDALEGIFTTLNIAQIHKLLTQFQPDDFAPDPVPRTTLDVLRNTINKTNTKITYLDGTVFVSVADL
jgi:hypothetical protein